MTQAEVSRLDAQFSYIDGDQVSQLTGDAAPMYTKALCLANHTHQCGCLQYVFMDTTSYEEHRLSKEDTWANYITEGSPVQLMAWNDKIISVELPNVVPLKVGSVVRLRGLHCMAAGMGCLLSQVRFHALILSADQ